MAVPFIYQDLLPLPNGIEPEWRLVTSEHVSTIMAHGKEILQVSPEGLRQLSLRAMRDINFLLRSSHLESLSKIMHDEEASENDKFVALELLKNACIASGFVLPSCQDTGTAIIMGKKGQYVWTNEKDAESLAHGVYDCYINNNLRYSQMAPLDMYKEVNTKCNLPAQIEIYSIPGNEYHFMFVAKGGGSANKTYLYQETKALLNPVSLKKFIQKKLRSIGTSACPPYHLALVIGGTSAEFNLKVVKLASTHYLDGLPTQGNETGQAFRDLELEKEILVMAQECGVGAQFGGKYFCHDVRVIRLTRHGASCPVGLGVSCSADRQIKAKITKEGIFVEALELDPARFLPVMEPTIGPKADVVAIDLNQPMKYILATLTKYPVKTRLSLTGTIIVGRDIAHAKWKEALDRGEGIPQYIKDHPVYYAGPAKTPEGLPSGSFGPTTAGRMDSYIPILQKEGGSFISLAKGNRSLEVTTACQKYGGFYLGSIGGPAAQLAKTAIKK
eukprot:Ihof_evm28s3 gene=Ihof_evmTU28s3